MSVKKSFRPNKYMVNQHDIVIIGQCLVSWVGFWWTGAWHNFLSIIFTIHARCFCSKYPVEFGSFFGKKKNFFVTFVIYTLMEAYFTFLTINVYFLLDSSHGQLESFLYNFDNFL